MIFTEWGGRIDQVPEECTQQQIKLCKTKQDRAGSLQIWSEIYLNTVCFSIITKTATIESQTCYVSIAPYCQKQCFCDAIFCVFVEMYIIFFYCKNICYCCIVPYLFVFFLFLFLFLGIVGLQDCGSIKSFILYY